MRARACRARLAALLEAEKQAKAAEAEFAKRKMEYQTANLAVIQQVVKLERDPACPKLIINEPGVGYRLVV